MCVYHQLQQVCIHSSLCQREINVNCCHVALSRLFRYTLYLRDSGDTYYMQTCKDIHKIGMQPAHMYMPFNPSSQNQGSVKMTILKSQGSSAETWKTKTHAHHPRQFFLRTLDAKRGGLFIHSHHYKNKIDRYPDRLDIHLLLHLRDDEILQHTNPLHLLGTFKFAESSGEKVQRRRLSCGHVVSVGV